MKTHTQEYKDKIKELGRDLDSKLTYELEGETIELGNEELNSITPHYEGAILKSVMKQLDIDSNVDIPIGTEVNYQFGLKVGNDYEYIDYGNYIVFSSEKQEDVNSYKIVAYDKMLYAMKPYEALTDSLGDPITYPITLRNYLIALARRLDIPFKNASDTFVNYDKEIKGELYLTEDGKSLDYTYRDVLDELSQATASSICISNDDELEVRYVRSDIDIAPLPMEYQQVEYIESNGTEYIDTGVQLGDSNFSISSNIVMLEHRNQEQALFSIWLSYYGYWNIFIHTTDKLDAYLSGHNLLNSTINYGSLVNVKFERTSDQWKLSLDNESITKTYSPTNTNNTTIKLFTRGDVPSTSASNTKIKMYNCSIIINNELVRNYIPCYRKSDNVIGLYDIVNNVFYTNQGTGNFTKGEDVFDTIDEEYLKDVNVNFGEKFGKVNALVLSRSADSDIIDRRDETSIAQNGLCEIKISDNQILNDDDRDLFIDGIFNKLKGLEYYVNDYTSTGITYYDFLDKYNVKVGDQFYPCIMLNDELEVSQGLVENIHAEAMEQEETDYTKSSKSDKLAIRTEIIVNKQKGRIDSIVGSVTNLESDYSDLDSQVQLLGTRVTQTESGVQTAISKATNVEDTINNGVPKVVTGIVTIDFNGIDVGRSDSKVHTKMRNNEFSVGNENSDDKLAFIGYDEIEQKSKAEMDNLKVRNWLNMGTHRVEKLEINGNYRTGHFYDG